uniref:Ubiquitin-like domain-containing protein n=1 Tax=Castor canadensis TaxID=51338 RepID=A0A8C0X341_CASCN
MFLTVKLLLGRRCSLKVTGKESVATLKKLVSERLHVPEEQQHLLFRGQLLADDKCLSDYCIGPNASINVIISRGGNEGGLLQWPMPGACRDTDIAPEWQKMEP